MTSLLDTWAWVEYFRGGPVGAQIRPLVEESAPATCVLTLAELSDLYARNQFPGLRDRVRFIASRGPVLGVTRDAALKAGATKWAQRSAGRAMGLGDAVIYEVARNNELPVVTGDEGFRGLPGIRFVEA